MRYFFILTVLACTLLAGRIDAQIIIQPGQAANTLAQMLAGPGVTITNATLSCPSGSEGLFKIVSPANIGPGMDSGIILSTGRVQSAGGNIGADGQTTSLASNDNTAAGDPFLNAYIGGTTENACALDFDFKPLGDTVKFDYTFASEEYTSFSCSQWNDVFAFFISGPGITGQKNMALVPGTTIPVTINSVVDTLQVNQPASTAPCKAMGAGAPFSMYYAGAKAGSTYDGFTTVLRAWEKVTPCSTYHLRLIIADIGDAFYDSGVWLRARSLSSNVSQIASSGLGQDTPYCVRTCYPGKFTFSRQDPLPSPLVVRFLIGGTAVNGVDYTQIADSVIIPANGTQATVNINALATVNPTGTKNVKLYLLAFDCDPLAPPVIADSATIDILDELKVRIVTPDTTICEGQTVDVVGAGDPDYTYSWGPTGAGILYPNQLSTTIKPLETTTYKLTAAFSVCPNVTREFTITVEPMPIVDAGDDTTICQWDSVKLHTDVNPKWYTGYTYQWAPSTFLNYDKDSDAVHTAHENTKLNVTVKTSIGCTGSDTVNVDIHPGNFGSAPQDKGVCPRDSIEIIVSGGVKFEWTPPYYINNTTDSAVKAAPPGPVVYTVYVTNEFTCKDTVTVPVATYPDAVLYLGEDVFLRPGERYQMDAQGNCIAYTWFPNVGLTSLNTPNPVASPDANTRYFVTGTTKDGCVTTDTVDVYRKETEMDIANAFSPGGLNHELKIVIRGIATLKYFRIFNRWGEKVFESADINKGWDGRYNDQDQPMGVYIYDVEAQTIDGRVFKKQGNVTLIR
jgi:gliding motility-associated-like protein